MSAPQASWRPVRRSPRSRADRATVNSGSIVDTRDASDEPIMRIEANSVTMGII